MTSETPPRRDCTYCPEPGADVCVRVNPSSSGPGCSVLAHRTCAEQRGVPVLYALLGTIGAEHFA
jgi:hypothetical protein